MERMRNVRSVSLGIWVTVGSRDEHPEKNGISHFLEHMFFKGTKKRTSRDIAVEIDSLGGDLNAFTSKESTTFYIKVLDEYLKKGVELITDLFMHPALPEEELEKEKGIIREEIKMVEDTPEDFVHDLFGCDVWGDVGLGQTVLGRKETVKTLARKDLLSHIRKYYGTGDTIVAAAGNFDPDRLRGMLNDSLGSLRRGSEPGLPSPPVFKQGTRLHKRDLAEVHICIGVEGLPQASPERYGLLLLNTILGGGLSSRLFQEIREKRGLAYSVYSFISSYRDAGLLAVYAGVSCKRAEEAAGRILEEMKGLPATITETELARAKDQLKGNLIMGLESTSRRMQNIASQEIYYGRYYSPSRIMKEIDSVRLPAVRGLAERLIGDKAFAVTVLGAVEEAHLKIS